MNVKYIGPGMAILAGKAIWSGECREVTSAQLREAQQYHPEVFVILDPPDPIVEPEDKQTPEADPAESFAEAAGLIEPETPIECLPAIKASIIEPPKSKSSGRRGKRNVHQA